MMRDDVWHTFSGTNTRHGILRNRHNVRVCPELIRQYTQKCVKIEQVVGDSRGFLTIFVVRICCRTPSIASSNSVLSFHLLWSGGWIVFGFVGSLALDWASVYDDCNVSMWYISIIRAEIFLRDWDSAGAGSLLSILKAILLVACSCFELVINLRGWKRKKRKCWGELYVNWLGRRQVIQLLSLQCNTRVWKYHSFTNYQIIRDTHVVIEWGLIYEVSFHLIYSSVISFHPHPNPLPTPTQPASPASAISPTSRWHSQPPFSVAWSLPPSRTSEASLVRSGRPRDRPWSCECTRAEI